MATVKRRLGRLASMLAIWVGKLTLLALRLIGRRGNALPGLVVEKLFPHFLERALTTLPEGVVVVTGTNGKTTTTKMISTILAEQYRVLTNDTGSNFVRGAITATVEKARWRGHLPYDVAVFELDEAWAVRFVALVPPQRTLLLNVMRDQLDRFGEIDTTAELLGTVAAATTQALVLNRDDPRIAALAAQSKAEVSYYGVAAELRTLFPNDEELYGGPIFVSTTEATAELRQVASAAQPQVRMRIADQSCQFRLHADGAHNAQNAAGAAALALTFGMSPAAIAAGLAKVEPAFGRGQWFGVDGRRVVLQLVKNPAGFRQCLRTLAANPVDTALVAINDDYADSRDVSWLWDVDFAPLATNAGHVHTAGTRAADMALRLRYAEIEVGDTTPELDEAVRAAIAASKLGGQVAIFSTYTAMWALHEILLRIGVAE